MTDTEGLHSICNTASGNRAADIVFVHGLGGSSHTTWCYGKLGKAGHFFWPQEIGQDLPDCGIWSIGYPAGITTWGKPGMIISKRAGNLSQKLVNAGLGNRPLLFITHSMGGLVVKYLIVDSQTQADQDRKSLVSQIRGIVFCGTPHRGSDYASAAASLGAFFGGSQRHVKEMAADSDTLDLLHDEFVEWHRRNPVPIESYAENVPLFRRRFLRGPLSLGLVVNRTSANPNIQGAIVRDLDEDHLGIVKPRSKTHDAYAGVLRFVKLSLNDTLSSALKGTPSSAQHVERFPSGSVSTRPSIGSIPVLDPRAQFRRLFVGRHTLLEDLHAILQTLLQSRAPSVLRGSGTSIRMLWVYGFGGMGKSWFLRKCCAEAEGHGEISSRLKIAVIDWHLQGWHQPASTPPDGPRDMFQAIAFRVAQLYGMELLDEYWSLRAEVDRSWEHHRQLHDQLDSALSFLAAHGPDWSTNTPELRGADDIVAPNARFGRLRLLERLLRERHQWSEDLKELSRRVNKLRLEHGRFDSPDGKDLFDTWAKELAGAEGELVSRPSGVLADSLQLALKKACSVAPLMLVLDTCEVLNHELDAWLRYLLAPLLNDDLPMLVMIGSRFRPDISMGYGDRGGWRDVVESTRLRVLPFNEDVRFTIREITLALELLAKHSPSHILPPIDIDDLAASLHRVTLGVPMAIGTLFAMHLEEEGVDSVLFDLASLDREASTDLDHTRAARTVIEAVASRFLTHLRDDPSRSADLQAIISLALLRKVNHDLLGAFWKEEKPIDRLRALTIRYALLADGDLHSTVRDYLRRHWRHNPPDALPHIASELLKALEEMRPPDDSFGSSEWSDWALEWVNLSLWTESGEGLRRASRVLPVLLVFDQEAEELQSLLKDVGARNSQDQELLAILLTPRWTFRQIWEDSDVLQPALWLEHLHRPDWSALESGCLGLVVGRALAEAGRHEEAVTRFQNAVESLGHLLPQRQSVGRMYFDAISELGQTADAGEAASKCLELAKKFDFEADEWDHGFYWVLHNAGRYDDAASYCTRIVASSAGVPGAAQDTASARFYLAHVLEVHLKRIEDAEKVLTDGLTGASGIAAANLHYGLASMLDTARKYEHAYAHYQEALSTFDLSPEDRGRLLLGQGKIARKLGKQTESIDLLKRAMTLIKQDGAALNSAAWASYLGHDDLDQAADWARRSVPLSKRNELYNMHTLAAVLIRKGEWEEGSALFLRWLSLVAISQLHKGWNDYHPQCCDIVRKGKSSELSSRISLRDGDPTMLALQLAFAGFSDSGSTWIPPSGLSDHPASLQDCVKVIVEQILSCIRTNHRCENSTATFPELNL